MEIRSPVYNTIDDYTFYLSVHDKRVTFADDPLDVDQFLTKACYREIPVSVQDEQNRANPPLDGRALICACEGRTRLSITIRLTRKPAVQRKLTGAKPENTPSNFETGLDPPKPGNRTQGPPPLIQLRDLRDKLFELLFPLPANATLKAVPAGLLVIAGRTGSAKSKIARGLIAKMLACLDKQVWKKRRPHLITLEDPTETAYYPTGAASEDDNRPVDYTARDRSRGDYLSLSQALKDALRQSPTVMFVGEVRDRGDWRAVVDFASTGHLVVVTTHSGSVSETFAKIFEATRAESPGERGFIARKVLGVVHQAQLAVDQRQALVPSVWRRTDAGVAALITDGLCSLLPQFPDESRKPETSSFGRRWFVRELLKGKPEVQQFELKALETDLSGI